MTKIPLGGFGAVLKLHNLPLPVEEFVFAAPRKWRFDYAWIPWSVALEVEGAVWTQGRHTRGSGFLKDMEKYNAAASRGWLVLRTIPDELCSAETMQLIETVLNLPPRHLASPPIEMGRGV